MFLHALIMNMGSYFVFDWLMQVFQLSTAPSRLPGRRCLYGRLCSLASHAMKDPCCCSSSLQHSVHIWLQLALPCQRVQTARAWLPTCARMRMRSKRCGIWEACWHGEMGTSC